MKKLILVFLSLFSTFAMAAESSLYDFSWLDKDKEVYVLQNRKFRKDGRVYVGATGAYTVNQAFLTSYTVTGRGGYFFSEDFGVEVVYGKGFGSENATAAAVRRQSTVPFYRKIDSYVGAMAMWAPFYSKINTFNKVFYFDWLFGLGAASITTKDNRNLFNTAAANAHTLTSQSQMGALWNTGFRFHVNQNWSVRLDVTGLTYSAKRSTSTTAGNSTIFTVYDLGLGLNYAF